MTASGHTAERIARRIAEDAFWHRDRCNWIGAALGPDDRGAETLVHRALSPAVYDGTAGIALFLGELSAVGGDELTRRTALGAIRQACSRAADLPAGATGLHIGRIGVAYAALRIGRLLGADEVWERGLALSHSRPAASSSPTSPAVLGGVAGEVLGLLAVRDEIDAAWPLQRAVALGDHLLAAAEQPGDDVLAWADPAIASRAPLAGVAHGASGVALALVALALAAEEERFLDAAQRAVRYERGLFDADEGNWQDLRGDGSMPVSAGTVTWCHGAPGIALARLALVQATGDPAALREMEIACATTARWTRASLRDPAADFSLCHGLAGNAEILGACALALPEAATAADLADEVATAGAGEHGVEGTWPCGVPAGATPSLLLGLAGIGMFFLRRDEPDIPSPLATGSTRRPATRLAEVPR